MISGANEEQLDIANDRAKLLLEIQDLQQRIDKAIEYIEKDKKNMDSSGSYVETYTGWKLIPEILEDLSKILKGE